MDPDLKSEERKPKITVNGKTIKGTCKWSFSTAENIKIPWENPFSQEEEELAIDILRITTDPQKENWRDGFDFSACLCVEIERGGFR